ncbi:CopG family transcriptional regulator [Argonema antarcticum]|uniref:CopG family transcriptional regulator n=1 Tax=Argonema antarcticum TaxID=2942763 RepID=UPI002013332A|nr:CopG family transcriptional regulator [Argonema antarcticum]MCL1472297.1 CopG family transcriptional regulator [Argonema antarcticum A004/B2]
MPRKNGVWINFQATAEEKQRLRSYCQQTQRAQSDVLREFIRSLPEPSSSPENKPEDWQSSPPN